MQSRLLHMHIVSALTQSLIADDSHQRQRSPMNCDLDPHNCSQQGVHTLSNHSHSQMPAFANTCSSSISRDNINSDIDYDNGICEAMPLT